MDRRESLRGRLGRGLRSPSAEPAWALAGIRVAFWLGAALALLWWPVQSNIPPFRAYEAATDVLFGTFARWDAQWFIHVVEHGYDSKQATVFFPLYPLVVRGVAAIVGSVVVAGVLVSLASAVAAAVVLVEIARPYLGARGARDAVLLIALYPVAFVFTAVQSDALFLALTAGAFLAALRGKAPLAGVLGGLAVATRLVGVALVVPLLVLLWPRRRTLGELTRPLWLLALPLALGLYALYLHEHVGDALAFQHAQQLYWLRRTPSLGPLGGLWESINTGRAGTTQLLLHLPRESGAPAGFAQVDQIATWNALHLPLLLAALVLTWVAWERLGAAFGLYSLTTLAVILLSPPSYFPLASFPRYLLADFPVFLALAAVVTDRPRARQIVVCSFAAIGAVAAVGYSRGVWIG